MWKEACGYRQQHCYWLSEADTFWNFQVLTVRIKNNKMDRHVEKRKGRDSLLRI